MNKIRKMELDILELKGSVQIVLSGLILYLYKSNMIPEIVGILAGIFLVLNGLIDVIRSFVLKRRG